MDSRTLFLALGVLFGFLCEDAESWWVSRRRRRRCSPSNCQVTGWSSWGSCSQNCGNSGTQSRQRRVTSVQSCGGGCYHLSESRACNRRCCPVNCAWSWGNWGACQGCGTGRRSRSVVVSRNPSCGGAACPGSRSESQSCNTGSYKWVVPLSYITEDAPTTPKKITLNMTSGTLTGLTDKKWIKANYQMTGFFRVTYSDDNWKLLIDQLNKNHTVFHPLDRAGIIDDAFNLARAGKLDYKIALSTTQYLHKEKNYVVWRVALSNLNYLNKVLSARATYALFRKYMVQKLKPMVKEMGWGQLSKHLDVYRQLMFLSNACDYGDPEALANATKIFNNWMYNNISVRAELRSLVYYTGVANGGDKEWDFVYSKFKTEKNPTEKSKLQSALSASQKPWILRKWLEYSLDSKIIRTQDTVYVITGVSQNNPLGRYIAWDFARANWVKCMEIMTANNFHVTQMTLGITAQFTTQFELGQAKEFWKKYPDAGAGTRARVQGMERIQASVDWTKNYSSAVEQWLKTEVKV